MDSKSYSEDQAPDPDGGPPQDLDTEFTVLGFYLMGGAWREDVTARDFAGEREQLVWHAMQAIHAAGEEIDRVRLKLELGPKKVKWMGSGYLDDLGVGCYPEMGIERFVAKLRDATAQRDVLHHAHILMTHIRLGDRTGAELIDMGTAAFAAMRQTGRGNGRFTYKDVPSIWTWEADVTWAVEGLIPEGAITLITGDSGHGKTIFTTAIAGAIATGSPFLGRTTRQRQVLYLDRENPAGVVKKHLFDLNIRETPDLTVWGNWCAHEADGPASASLLKFAHENPVMIFDPSIAFHPGDEQSATETRQFMQHCRNLAAAGATVILLHHVGKGENAKMYRGSSDYKAAVDLAFLLEKLGDPAGPLKDMRIVPFKNRYGGSGTIALSFKNGVFTANQRSETCQEIMERLVRDNPDESLRSLVDIGRAEGLSKHQAEQQLSLGVKAGRFEVRKHGRSHGYYIREGGLVDL